jgi:hypothetical protein
MLNNTKPNKKKKKKKQLTKQTKKPKWASRTTIFEK